MQQIFGSCCCLVITLLWIAFGVESYRAWKRGKAVPKIGTLPLLRLERGHEEIMELTEADVEEMPLVVITSKLPVAQRVWHQRSTFIDYVNGAPPSTVFAENNEDESPVHRLDDGDGLGYLGPPARVLLPGHDVEWFFDEIEATDRQAAGELVPHPDPIPELHLPKKPVTS